ncbi:hypothetical protein JNB91_19725 [Rhizobium wenxiniae]|uniref:hypothetical protein n=1 Tax=Rhizobium wenxiniae TaxID=1737357 RepID=UPI001C6EE7BF|nr:hypothetical protein [Rhizobium wenxiniae]MBW9090042.1 hypothetical protein [Rhizobium wenxiniae]
MNLTSYPSPTKPGISLPSLSILGQPPLPASDAVKVSELVAESGTRAPAFIMVGLDDKGKPHASWFAADHADAAAAAAELMGMALVEVADDLAAIAVTLPQGKLFESGKAFVPFVKRSTYDVLAAHLSDDYLTAAAQRVHDAAGASADYAEASKGEAPPRKLFDWRKIAVGDVVLASDGPSEGWYECKVIKVQADSHYLLQWRDWPEVESFTRYVTDIGLLHPELATEAPE